MKCLNRLDVDAVLILGDWLYQATTLDAHLSPFKTLNKPCYTVLSDADTQQVVNDAQNSEPASNMQLMNILPTLVFNYCLSKVCVLPGLTSSAFIMAVQWIYARDWTAAQRGQPLVIATHDIKQLEANPRTLSDANNDTLVIAGQTHGGRSIYLYWHRWWSEHWQAINWRQGYADQIQPNNPIIIPKHSMRMTNPANATKYGWILGLAWQGFLFRFNCPLPLMC